MYLCNDLLDSRLRTTMLSTPIVLIIFNRPELTKKVVDTILKAEPTQLYVIADGPRGNSPVEETLCNQARAVVESTNWNCQLFRNYSDQNLGCQRRIYTGLNWVFDHVESAIILEDDCLSHHSFFQFCDELLDRYKDDRRITAISGNNFQFERNRTEDSYYFSRYPHCWGWATWRRAWLHCDITMEAWPEVKKNNHLRSVFSNSNHIQYWSSKFQDTYENKIDSWSFPWTLSCWLQNGLTVLPKQNLVKNIGFGEGGTHHRSSRTPFANMPTLPMKFPLQHPDFVIRHNKADAFTQFYQFGLVARVIRKSLSLLPCFLFLGCLYSSITAL